MPPFLRFFGGGVETKSALARTFKLVYGWMAVGLTLSGVLAWYVAHSGFLERLIQGPGFIGFIIAEILLVLFLGMGINKLYLDFVNLFLHILRILGRRR